MLGTRTDIPDLMRAADAYVMSSAWEGLPLVLLEASASGLPIVATDVGGNRELVVDGTTGQLVAPQDGLALAVAMRELRDQPPRVRARLGKAARDYVESRYSLAAIADRWIETYQELLATRLNRRDDRPDRGRGRGQVRLAWPRGPARRGQQSEAPSPPADAGS